MVCRIQTRLGFSLCACQDSCNHWEQQMSSMFLSSVKTGRVVEAWDEWNDVWMGEQGVNRQLLKTSQERPQPVCPSPGCTKSTEHQQTLSVGMSGGLREGAGGQNGDVGWGAVNTHTEDQTGLILQWLDFSLFTHFFQMVWVWLKISGTCNSGDTTFAAGHEV